MSRTPAPPYSIGDLAREFDLTTRAIRFYEDMGLLQPQRQGAGGRVRVYAARDRARLGLNAPPDGLFFVKALYAGDRLKRDASSTCVDQRN